MLLVNALSEWVDREILWSAAEEAEKQKTADYEKKVIEQSQYFIRKIVENMLEKIMGYIYLKVTWINYWNAVVKPFSQIAVRI